MERLPTKDQARGTDPSLRAHAAAPQPRSCGAKYRTAVVESFTMRCWIRYPLQCYNDHISLTAFGGHVVARRHCRCILVGSLMSNTTRYIRNPSAH